MTKNDLTEELNAIFFEQLFGVLISRHIFLKLKPVLKDNLTAEPFWMFIVRCYKALACCAVRCAVDKDHRSRSLLKFLNDLKDPTSLAQLSRANYLKSQGNAFSAAANRKYDSLARNAPNITTTIIDEDIAKLQAMVSPIKGFVDTTIAHSDRSQLVATMSQLEDALDTIADMYGRYATILDAVPTDVTNEYETNIERVIAKLSSL